MERAADLTRADNEREWLETDGRGGYAAGTLSGSHSRRYHGLLVANLRAPAGRHVLLSKVEDSVLRGSHEVFLTAHRYPGVVFPPSPPPLACFSCDPYPAFLYEEGGLCVEKALLLSGGGTLLLRYLLKRPEAGALLRLRPLFAFRGYHGLMKENQHIRGGLAKKDGLFVFSPYEGMPGLTISAPRPARFIPAPYWYRNFEYRKEKERGFDWREDLFSPGVFEFALAAGQEALFSFSLEEKPADPAGLWGEEERRRLGERQKDEALAAQAGEDGELLLTLLSAGRKFLITTPAGAPAIVAGYPWFESWGRDTLISLPGLAFLTGRLDEGARILADLGSHQRRGILPNFFDSEGRPAAYNSVDSSLLFFRAVQFYLQVTGDYDLVRRLFWPAMKEIVAWFLAGTDFSIKADERGLLAAGDGTTALTWMDAQVDGVPVTPRHGLAVEINALWYNALCFCHELAGRFGEPQERLEEVISRLRGAFRETFWLPGGYLADCIRDGRPDGALRPNQLFAVSLPFSPLTGEEQALVLEKVRQELLTPCGLRTLAPSDPAYRGRYEGGPKERDAAYHQGTVWPWLLGPFGDAALRAAADPERERKELLEFIRRFLRRHLPEEGIGTVSEIFDGDPPHRPNGCPAQAWSVAELTRLLMRLAVPGQ